MIVGTGTYTFEVAPPWQLPIEGPNREVVGVGVNSKDEVHIITRSPHPVLVFTRAGKFLRQWGDGIFGSPHGIHIAADDCVYIADNRDQDRKSTRLNSSHVAISYAVFCLKKKKKKNKNILHEKKKKNKKRSD